MKNVIIWRFHQDCLYPAILDLKERGIINIVAWIGDKFRCPHCTHHNYSFSRITSTSQQYNSKIDWNIYEAVYQRLPEFMDMYARKNFMYYGKTINDYIHIFNIYFQAAYSMLTENKIDWILFGDIPHEGPEFIIYLIAKELGINTLVVHQSYFPNKFFYIYDIDDFGTFSNVEPVDQIRVVKIPRQYKKKIIYVNNKVKIRAFRRDDYEKWLRSLRKVPTKLKDTPIFDFCLGKCVKWKRRLEYRRNLKKLANNRVDLTKPFVYFPLHLQPEMTTSALGGVFNDQILAVEKLRELLPEDWYIYVKEYPIQTEFMRPNYFFERLKSIPNTQFITRMNTYNLMENCRFVATITGTAGWEAISGGKCALVFGKAWYKGFPGVFDYNPNLEVQDIIDYQINHEEIENKMQELFTKMGNGVIEPVYSKLVNNFTLEENVALISSFLEHILSKK